MISLAAQSNRGRDQFTRVIPLVFPCGCYLRVTSGNCNGKDKTGMMCIHIPLRAANVGREKLFLPRLVAALVLIGNDFPKSGTLGRGRRRALSSQDDVASHRPRSSCICVSRETERAKKSEKEKQAKRFGRFHGRDSPVSKSRSAGFVAICKLSQTASQQN